MEATYIPGQLVEAPISRAKPWEAVKAAFHVLGELLAESAKGDDFNRTFTSPSGAQFAALSQAQQNQQLDRGFRP